MARLRLTDDAADLEGQVIFEPKLNPWLGAALAPTPGAGGEPGEGVTAAAALQELQTQPVPGQTLGRSTAKAALCGRLGAALVRRARAWEREAWFRELQETAGAGADRDLEGALNTLRTLVQCE